MNTLRIAAAGLPVALVLAAGVVVANREFATPTLAAATVVRTSQETCNISWSDLYWDKEAQSYYIWFTNNCDVAYYCYVRVTRSGATNEYGWCVPAKESRKYYVGDVGRDDTVDVGVGEACE